MSGICNLLPIKSVYALITACVALIILLVALTGHRTYFFIWLFHPNVKKRYQTIVSWNFALYIYYTALLRVLVAHVSGWKVFLLSWFCFKTSVDIVHLVQSIAIFWSSHFAISVGNFSRLHIYRNNSIYDPMIRNTAH